MIGFRKRKTYSDAVFPEKVEISEKNYKINVNFSPKKSSSVTIKNNIIVFRLSSYLTKIQAEEHFETLLKKIKNKIEKGVFKNNQKTINNVISDLMFAFGDDLYRLEFTPKVRTMEFQNGVFYINPDRELWYVEKYIVKSLILKYSEYVEQYVRKLNSQTYNYKINDITLKLVQSKWGHCTHDDKIMINLKLLNARADVLDYVVMHEIAHIKHKNHSSDFWEEVKRFCPNYKALRKELKENPPGLFK